MEKKLGELTFKEINQQPEVFKGVSDDIENICGKVKDIFENFKPEEIIFVGCGTSHYLAQSAVSIFSHYNNIPARAAVASEIFLNGDSYFKGQRVLMVPITRASSTTEVRMAIKAAKSRPNVATLAVTCDIGSAEINDYYLLSPKAEDKSVVMTSTYTSMLYLILVMSLCLAGKEEELNKIKAYPEISASFMDRVNEQVKAIVDENKDIKLFICLGQGSMYGVANEAMLKIKEMTISNSEAYHSLEYRHGPISLVEKDVFTLLFVTENAKEYELKLAKEIKELGGKVAIICSNADEKTNSVGDYVIELKDSLDDYLRTPLSIIPVQLLALHFASSKGMDVDSPRNLSRAIV
ncbi:MAG: SIS domain-containing protein, partial [Clostridium sp.]|nr:SIS domain-containing protein [Clostridium sp.]